MSRTRLKRVRRRMGLTVAGVLGPTAMNALHRSLDLEVHGEHHHDGLSRRGGPILYTVWHGRMLTPIWRHRHQNITVLVSEHSDGETLTRVMSGLGYGAARGSSTRGGAKGLKALVRAARNGQDLAITPDGPRGPRHVVKGGLIVAAQLTGASILPLSASARRRWTLGSWDAFQIPKPASSSYLEYGAPIHVPRGADPEERERLRAQVEETLITLTARVDARARGRDPDALGPQTSGPRPDPNEAGIRAAVD